MSNYLDSLNNVAKAIQSAENSVKPMTVEEMPERILSLSGGEVVLDSGSYTHIYGDGVRTNVAYRYNGWSGEVWGGYDLYTVTIAQGTEQSFLANLLTKPENITCWVYGHDAFKEGKVIAIDTPRDLDSRYFIEEANVQYQGNEDSFTVAEDLKDPSCYYIWIRIPDYSGSQYGGDAFKGVVLRYYPNSGSGSGSN